MPTKFVSLSFFVVVFSATSHAGDITWKKHVVMDQGHCNTAVAIDVNQDGLQDVTASFNGRVSLFVAPDWQETILHQFIGGNGACIHSSTIDADGDGDLDWVGTIASDHPFWLENPGPATATKGAWIPRMIDHEITGIHCIRTSDIDNDGISDLIINNFEPEKGIGDSMAWFSRPKNPLKAKQWNRHIFADKDARGGSHYMGAGDIDGDGWKEIAVGAKGKPFADGNWFAYWKNPGKSNVTGAWEKVILAENQTAATCIFPADVNGDGKPDWVASRGHGNGVIWFENPSWEIHTIDGQIEFPHSLTVADHDQDGDMDVATCGYGSELVMWYENNGKGEFEHHRVDGPQQSYDLRTIDMDGDGDLDLLNAGRGSKNVIWYENTLKPAGNVAIPVHRILFGSCIKQDRPMPILTTIADEKPDVFLFLGDNIYGDTTDMVALRKKYATLAANPDFQKLRASTRLLATWDDHDYGANNAGSEYSQRIGSQEAFLDFWGVANDSFRRQRRGVYDAKIIGPPGKRVQFIMLDTRYFRSEIDSGKKRVGGSAVPSKDPDRTMLGDEQWRWLETQLRKSAELRILASGIQCVASDAGQETWSNLPLERQRLFDLIRETHANGCLIVSGDRHWSELSMTDENTPYPLYDLTSSSLNQIHGRGTPTANLYRADKNTYHQENFGVIDIDWNSANPTVTMEIRDANREVQLSQRIRLSDLQ